MRTLVIVLCLGLGLIAFAEDKKSSAGRVPVVVELFTSEGCSSCPPADALLAALSRQPMDSVQIIALGEHVDYWNELGWKDRFSAHEYSVRQDEYARRFGLDSVYTPQMVIDGRSQFVGNDAGEARKAIEAATHAPKMAQVSLRRQGDRLEIKVENAASSPAILLVITEDNLSTDVRAGENHGRQLNHQAVVRYLRSLGTTRDGKFVGQETLKLDPSWKRANLKAVVLAQDRKSGAIIGAAAESLQ